MPVAENLLARQFSTTAPDQAWLTDITYIATDEGWLYLAGHKDLFSGEIVGYAMGGRMTKNLVNQSLFREVTSKRPRTGLRGGRVKGWVSIIDNRPHYDSAGKKDAVNKHLREFHSQLIVWLEMSGHPCPAWYLDLGDPYCVVSGRGS